jgi:hypothetical protein
MATVDDIGSPLAPLSTPPNTHRQAAVRDAINKTTTNDVWTAWTPTLTGFTASAVDCSYHRTPGGLVHVVGVFTVSAVTGAANFTLPVAATKDVTGAAYMRAGGGEVLAVCRVVSPWAVCTVSAMGAAATYVNRVNTSASVPGVWGTAGDSIWFNFFYRAAPLP